ncbi:MAG: SAM-dependent methyltransferase [Chitinophagaceae bacterium]|nr:SAM-dependent methyltransferase [Chitinophagaceae bacterium]
MIKEPSSYRDPSGYIFFKEGVLYRQVNQRYKKEYEQLMNSGCYQELLEKKMLVPHEQLDQNLTGEPNWLTTLKPILVPFISYSWEWSFQMLKDAALLTLDIQTIAIRHGLSLKDASCFNVQFFKGQPLFIDSLSFEFYDEQKPWIAYLQFCEQFLAPLLLMHYRKLSLHELSLAYPEGIPLAIASRLLPFRSRLSIHCYLHIHLNARVSRHMPGKSGKPVRFNRKKMNDVISSLRLLVNSLQLKESSSTWSAYYEEASQRDNYLPDKKQIINDWIKKISPEINNASDLGANDGEFSRLFANRGIPCIAADLDATCINRLYLQAKKENNSYLHPLIMDLSNPSPSIGVNNLERPSFLERGSRDAVMALALIHHLAIGRNIPFDKIAAMFARLCKKWLIIEFVPKEDEKVQFMLQQKQDIYDEYDRTAFESAFNDQFILEEKKQVRDSCRALYLYRRKHS